MDDALVQGRLSEAEDWSKNPALGATDIFELSSSRSDCSLPLSVGRIVARPDIEDLARMRLPYAVAAMLVEAVFHVHVEPQMRADPVAISSISVHAWTSPWSCLPGRSQASTAAQRQAWIVYAAALEPPSTAIRDVVLELTDPEALERRFVEKVASLVKEPEARLDDESYIEQLVRGGDLSGAWNAAESASLDETTRVRALLPRTSLTRLTIRVGRKPRTRGLRQLEAELLWPWRVGQPNSSWPNSRPSFCGRPNHC